MPNEHSRTLDLERLLRILRRRGWLILLCLVAVTASAVAFSLRQDKQYAATASLLFRDPAVDRTLFQTSYTPSVDPQRQSATNVRLVSLPSVANNTAARLGGRLTGDAVEDKVKVENEGASDVVAIKATDRSPRFAATLANTFASEYITLRRAADRAVIRQALNLVRRRLDDVSASDRPKLQARADDLKILAALQNGKAEVAQQASVPSSPSSPRPVRNGVIGGVLGLFLGLALAMLLERLDRRIKEPDELEQTYRLPILAAIPESRALRNSAGGESNEIVPGPEWESFRKLRAKLRYFNVDRDTRSVLITSAGPEEGKTTVASNLAIAAAFGGQTRVLLLEADLRRSALAQRYDLAPIPGLAELLTHDIAIPEAIQRFRIVSGPNRYGQLDVIVAGAIPPNPSELLESRKMGELLDELAQTHDLVIIDTPPVSVVADAMPLVSRVDGVIVVSWIGTTTRDGAMHLRHELETLDATVLGLVINKVRAPADGYYGYGYGADQMDLRTLAQGKARVGPEG
jgi:succinoglycan biosynthesis transport protein ExoP